ncbi:hypothetical protein HRI_004825400 [Hibiscus trionum]|uniref:Reverse transcriptase domain-containing protein n=1 Tax=Hibiscus trionum TaxID=183268 RepID=A0A9W7MSV1_HIBTR|nr:hypothetical protein HRI_004825400 [Hibiscus trionum]
MVRSLIKEKKPKIIFLQETKLNNFPPSIVRRLGVGNGMSSIFAPALGSAGGLFVAWDSDFILNSTHVIANRYIALFGNLAHLNRPICFLNIYGPSSDSEKHGFFNELQAFIAGYDVLWCLGGDFNVFLNKEEKCGRSWNYNNMDMFRNFIQVTALVDLPLKGGRFTWSSNRDPPTLVRLDRFLISSALLSVAPNLSQSLLPKYLSDHNGILLAVECLYWGPKTFKLFNYQMEEECFEDLISRTIARVKPGGCKGGIVSILRLSKQAIKQWSSTNSKCITSNLKEVELQISNIESAVQQGSSSHIDFDLLSKLRAQLQVLLRKEESVWIQNSRLKWFTEGDHNTKFFHLVASNRRRNNLIHSIKIGEDIISEPSQIKEGIFQHFSDQYKKGDTLKVEVFDVEFSSLSNDQASFLERKFSENEVWEAILSMESSRAPGPDGFNIGFYKKFWGVLKGEIMNFFENFYNGLGWDAEVNYAFIALIPKCTSPENINDFRPISLVSSIYKILAKVLSRRFKGVLQDIISDTQFAFVAGRQILDCSFLANEAVDYIQRMGLKGLVFKTDFRRAYDSVDWDFLIFILKKMGCGPRWCNWIYQCISTASMSILVNGSPTPRFPLGRGLLQGCPLSPMLFNVVGEALSRLIHKANDIGLFSGFQIGRGTNSESLSHLQFADDLIFFSGASLSHILNIRRILRIFEIAAGLQLNLGKCRLYGININESTLQSWASKIGCAVGTFPAEYLGLPLGPKRNSRLLWEPVINKFHSHLAGWKGCNLSFSGRLILIKSVLSSLPTYFLSLFRMPSEVLTKLNGIMARFLWGGSETISKMHWVKWKSICRPLEMGGLGVCDLSYFNRALLGKWIFKYASDKDSSWKRIICAKTNSISSSILPDQCPNRLASWVWKGILSSFFSNDNFGTSIQANSKIQVGDGTFTSFWSDSWLCDSPLQSLFPRIFTLSTNKAGKVSEFGSKIGPNWVWNMSLRRRLFDWENVQWSDFMNLLNNFASVGFNQDTLVWKASGNGIFSIKSCRNMLHLGSTFSFDWKKYVWFGAAPPKVELFLWRVLNNGIPVRVNLARRGVNSGLSRTCPLCEAWDESAEHLFLHCHFSWRIWAKLASIWDMNIVLPSSIMALLYLWAEFNPCRFATSIWNSIPLAAMWTIWLMRNDVIFNNAKPDHILAYFLARFRIACWFKAYNRSCSIPTSILAGDLSLADSSVQVNKSLSLQVSWSPPHLGFAKINVDDATSSDGTKAGIGGTIRVHDGSSISSFSEQCPGGPPIIAEIVAMKAGLDLALSLDACKGLRLILKSDCSEAVNWVSDPSSAPVSMRSLVQDVSDLCSKISAFVRWIPRAENSAADALAKAGIG